MYSRSFILVKIISFLKYKKGKVSNLAFSIIYTNRQPELLLAQEQA